MYSGIFRSFPDRFCGIGFNTALFSKNIKMYLIFPCRRYNYFAVSLLTAVILSEIMITFACFSKDAVEQSCRF